MLDTPGVRSALAKMLVAVQFVMYLTGQLSAQSPVVPKFPINSSAIEIRGDVRPQEYVGVTGHASAWLGTEGGTAELWVHPFKLATDFSLNFQIPDYVDPIRGEDVARTVIVRPEATTIVYSHATFTVKQHIFAPVNRPGLIVLLDVDTFRDMAIRVQFKPVFQYAWPAAFGGQYSFWNEDAKAFVLSESRRERNAMIGSPWTSSATTQPAHALSDAPNTFVIAVDADRMDSEFIPIVVAAGQMPRDSISALYAEMLQNARALYEEKRDYMNQLLATTVRIDSPDDELDRALQWASVNLDEQLVCNPDLGCGLVAGWGMSKTSTRPGFGWFFGGDAAINSFAMDAVGLWDQTAAGIRFLARYQNEAGKITHEISQSAAHTPWFEEFPYAFIHADTTPYWIVMVWRYWRATGDTALLREVWPNVERAYAWCLTHETDYDGLMENTTAGLGAIEVGGLSDRIHQDVYLAGVWVEATRAMMEMALAMDDAGLSQSANRMYEVSGRNLNDMYWREEDGHHAFGTYRDGSTNGTLTVWPATAGSFGLFSKERADRTFTKLATDSLSSDWGARLLSTGSEMYDPMHYNNGAVWPFMTGFLSWAQYRYSRPWAGFPLVNALKQITYDWARGRHVELLSGDFYRPLDTSVPHQFFATSMFVTPLIKGMLGWDPNAPENRASLAPQLPPDWESFRVDRLRVGEGEISMNISQSVYSTTYRVESTRDSIVVDLAATVPADASDIAVSIDGTEMADFVINRGPHDSEVAVSLAHLSDAKTVEVSWTGGMRLAPNRIELEPGQRSRGYRIADKHYGNGEWKITIEGEAGRTYELELIGKVPENVTNGDLRAMTEDGATLLVAMPNGLGRQTVEVTLHQ